MRLLRAALATLVAVFLAGPALAQGTGGLQVKVIDSGGLPLPGATVTIEHETGNVKPYTTLSNAKGVAEFPVLRPGPGYIISVSMPSFGTRREENIRVPIGQVEIMSVQLAEEIVERVRVVATQDVVELETTSSTTKFSDEFVQDLPVPGRFYQNVLTLAPGVNDADGDGNPTVHGSRSRDFKATVGGVSNVDPLTGQFMSLVNADSIEEMEVVTSGAGVEFGRAQGGFATIIQKQGTNQFEGTFSFLYRTSKLDGTGSQDINNLPDPEFDELHPAIQVSGPIVKDKLWYRLSHELLDQEDPVNTVGQIVTQDRKQGIHADQLTWQASPRNKLAFQIQSDPLEITNFGVSSTTPAESSQKRDIASSTYSLRWTAPYSPKLLIESTVAWQDLDTSLSPSQEGVQNDCLPGNPFFSTAICTDNTTGVTSGSDNVVASQNSQRMSLLSQATLYGGQFWGANHQFKFGLTVENERFFRELHQGVELDYFVLDILDEGETTPQEIQVISAQIAVPTDSRARSTGTNWGIYLEDQIKPTNNLVITVGLRIDQEELKAKGLTLFDPENELNGFLADRAACAPGATLCTNQALRDNFTIYEGIDAFLTEISRLTGQPESALIGNLANVQRQAAFSSIERGLTDLNVDNTNLSPALSLSWDPWSNGKNKFAASARRYYDKIILGVPLIQNNPATTNLVFDVVENLTGSGYQLSGLRTDINPAVNIEAVSTDLSTPYQDEWRILYERELFTETLMRVEYVNRKYRDQLQNVDLNHAPGDFGRCRISDPFNTNGLLVSPGSGQTLTDPYTGQTYVDTDPGDGDGILDECVGQIEVVPGPAEIRMQQPDGFTDLYTQNPIFGTYQVVGNFNEADYDAFVFELIRRQYRSWELQGSYTWSMAEGNGEDFQQFVGLDQSVLDDEYGYQSNDQRHVVKMSATTITPWGFRLGGRVLWQSGLPYSILESDLAFDAVPPAFNTFGSFSPSRQRLQYPTHERNSERNDSQWLFDVKFTKEMNLGRGLNLQVSAEIFNLLNDGTYQVYNPDFETGFQVNGNNAARFEFGRRWQLGMKLAF